MQRASKHTSRPARQKPRLDPLVRVAALEGLLRLARGPRVPLVLFGRERDFCRRLADGASPTELRREFSLTIEELAGAYIRTLRS